MYMAKPRQLHWEKVEHMKYGVELRRVLYVQK